MPIETVLLPVSDADEDRLSRLVDTALEIATPTGATVVVAHAIRDEDDHVVTTIPAITGGNNPQLLSQPEYDDLLAQYSDDNRSVDEVVARHETVQSVTDRLDEADIEYHVRGAVGDPSEAIIGTSQPA